MDLLIRPVDRIGRRGRQPIERTRNCSTGVFSSAGDALALALVLGAPVRADRAVVETTESDQSVAQALTTIENCSTAPRSVRASQTVTTSVMRNRGAGSGSQPP